MVIPANTAISFCAFDSICLLPLAKQENAVRTWAASSSLTFPIFYQQHSDCQGHLFIFLAQFT